MTPKDLFTALKDGNPQLAAELNAIKEKLKLDKLYFIGCTENDAKELSELMWGARKNAGPLPNEEIIKELGNFLKEIVGIDPEGSKMTILGRADEEVDYIFNLGLRSYVESHGGNIKIVSADEKTGLVVISLTGACAGCPSSIATMEIGVKNTLKATLPWVKEVKSGIKPQEPDFGVQKVLEDSEKEMDGKEEK